MSKDFITIQEAADALGKSTQTIRRMIKRGDLTAKRVKTPQGFHYVIPKSETETPKKTVVDTSVVEAPKPMLHNTATQKADMPQKEEPKENPTSQSEVLINQQPDKVQEKATNEPVDKIDRNEVFSRHHKETMALIDIIEKLQLELDTERRKPKSFLAYFFDWLTK